MRSFGKCVYSWKKKHYIVYLMLELWNHRLVCLKWEPSHCSMSHFITRNFYYGHHEQNQRVSFDVLHEREYSKRILLEKQLKSTLKSRKPHHNSLTLKKFSLCWIILDQLISRKQFNISNFNASQLRINFENDMLSLEKLNAHANKINRQTLLIWKYIQLI